MLASTLTTMAVFIPVFFVQEEAGQLFRDIAVAISAGVGLSLLVSVTEQRGRCITGQTNGGLRQRRIIFLTL